MQSGAEHLGVHGLVVRTLAFTLGVMGDYHKVTSEQRQNLTDGFETSC